MKLGEYLTERKISAADFAVLLKQAGGKKFAITGEAVRLWTKGDRRPRPRAMTAITEVTGGLVQPNDFYEAA